MNKTHTKYLMPALIALIMMLSGNIETAAQAQAISTDEMSELDEYPAFRRGLSGIHDFIAKNMRYPLEPYRMNMEGRVVVRFVVSKTGKVKGVEVIEKSVHPDLDKEAVRIVKAMPKWKPGILNGEPVDVYYTQPFVFKIPPPRHP